MTASPHTIGQEQPLSTAQEMMRTNSIRHLPVKHGGQLVGVLSDRDIEFALRMEKTSPESLKVEDALTSSVYTVSEKTPLGKVATEMGERRIGCALIIDERERLVGIFTAVDACIELGELLAS